MGQGEEVTHETHQVDGFFVKYNAESSESSMKTKHNTHVRIDQYLLYIDKPEFLLKDVDKEFCKGFIAFLKTCTYNDGKND